MRALVSLTPRRKTEYQQDYNHNVRGFLYDLIEDSHPRVHGNHKDVPFTFSNFFPPSEFLPETTKIIVSSYDRNYMTDIVEGICSKEEINIGEMPFWFDNLDVFNVTPSDSGKLRTEHGVYCTVNSERDNPTYWREEHGVDGFKQQIERSLDWKMDEFSRYDSDERDFPVFDRLELRDTFARPVNIESDSQITVILSDWELEYNIRSNMHREYIQLALDTGIGWKNTLGFGFLNKA